MNLTDTIRYIKGIGPKKEEKFKKININTVEDLLNYYPRDYDNRSNYKKLSDGFFNEKATYTIRFLQIIEDRKAGNFFITSFLAQDDTRKVKITFFNMRFIKNQIKLNKYYFVTGKLTLFRGQIQLVSPTIEEYKKDIKFKILPLYKLKKGIKNTEIVNAVLNAINFNLIKESLPEYLLDKYNLVDKNTAIKNIHFPSSMLDLSKARNRLVFEELLIFQLAILSIKNKNKVNKSSPFKIYDEIFNFIKNLPFTLTSGQKKVLEEIFSDLKSNNRMNRLLQGDVGSGKTIVAIIAMYLTYLNGYQSTIMAPTEILAKQHLEVFRKMLEPLGVKVELLVGSTSKKNKDRILSGIYSGEIDILIGTHALLEEKVEFNNLGLNITDEQHRFGVKQRETLLKKNNDANNLVMTATPIPRTLALILYADLSISTIDNLPPKRKKIDTIAINKNLENRALNFIVKQVEEGRQAYIICPLIEENENLDLDSAVEVYNELKDKHFKNLRTGLLHGRMNANEKNKIMEDFKNRLIDIIISTTVIEVGVNVPNASVIFIYNAQRFGLAQLHQLRGRVGRAEHKSYCILYNTSNTQIAAKRMKVMIESTDGFYIANKDFELRGGGDMLGIKQSGLIEFKIADLFKDIKILKQASEEAKNILENDPMLTSKENELIKKEVQEKYKVDYTLLN